MDLRYGAAFVSVYLDFLLLGVAGNRCGLPGVFGFVFSLHCKLPEFFDPPRRSPPSYLIDVAFLQRRYLQGCICFGVDSRIEGASVAVDLGLVLLGVDSRPGFAFVAVDLELLLLGVDSLFGVAFVSVGFGPVSLYVTVYMHWLGGGQPGFEIDSRGALC